jgi:hypothetical protein
MKTDILVVVITLWVIFEVDTIMGFVVYLMK